MQKIISGEKCYTQIGEVLKTEKVKKYMLVCRPSFFKMGLDKYFESLDIPCVYFTDFTVNPKYEEVCDGVELFKKEKNIPLPCEEQIGTENKREGV